MAIDESKLDQFINITTVYSIGQTASVSSENYFQLKMDVEALAKKTLDYFKIHYKKVDINSFYDKQFLDRMKIIIKNPEKFDDYLNHVELNLKDFINFGVYLFPQVFSSSIVKLLKEKLILFKEE